MWSRICSTRFSRPVRSAERSTMASLPRSSSNSMSEADGAVWGGGGDMMRHPKTPPSSFSSPCLEAEPTQRRLASRRWSLQPLPSLQSRRPPIPIIPLPQPLSSSLGSLSCTRLVEAGILIPRLAAQCCQTQTGAILPVTLKWAP